MASSMTKLKSSMIEKGVPVMEGEPALIDGLYGTNGFYFQQRRGRLDLRGLAQIDIERVVRDVDVDILQMHLENITFCNLREEDLRFITDQHVVKLFRVAQLIIEYLLYAQEQLSSNLNALAGKYAAKKRSLISKRKELEELQEQSKVLRAQLRSKKKGIHTLEALLKDSSNRERSKSRKHSKEEVPQPVPQPVQPAPQQAPPTKPPFTKVFVTGPNGWCVEFNLRNSSVISDVKRDVKQAFVSKKDVDEEYGPDPNISLIYQGRVLLNDSTIDDIDIKYGDTIVAIIEKSKGRKNVEEIRPKIDESRNQMNNKELMDFILRQHEISSNEMREGWQNLIQTLCMAMGSNREKEPSRSPDPLGAVDGRLAAIEKCMKDQLQTQYLEMKSALAQFQSRKLIVGDLESDNDDRLYSREDLANKLRDSNTRIRGLEEKVDSSEMSYEDLKRLQKRQAEELNELKRLIQERNSNTPTVIIQNQQPQPIIQQVEVPVPQRRIKRSIRSPPRQEPEDIPSEPEVEPEPEPEPIIKPKPVVAPAATPKPKLIPAAAAAPPPIQTRESPKPIVKNSPRNVKIYFSPNLNPGLRQFNLRDGVEISVLENIPASDLVFEIRSKIAEKAGIPLPRVALNLDGKTISLGIDVDSATFIPTTVSDLAEAGDLTLEFRDTITDSQIDLLVNKWEKSPYFSENESPRNSIDTKNSRGSRVSEGPLIPRKEKEKDLRKSEEFYRKTLSESQDLGVLGQVDLDEEEETMESLRRSLGNVLGELSDKERLTDDEYDQKMKFLQGTLKSAPKKIVSEIRSFQDSTPHDVHAAIHSESEGDYSSSDGKLKKRGVATMKFLSASQNSLRLSQSGKKKRDYDSAEDDLTLTGSLSRSFDKRNLSRPQNSYEFQGRDSPGVPRRYSSASESDGKDDHKDSLQYTRDSLSTRGFDETIDTIPGRSVGRSSVGRSSTSSRPRYEDHGDSEDDGSRSAFDTTQDEEKNEDFGGTNTQSAGTYTYTSDMSNDNEILDFNQTVNTDISLPGEDIEERANAYERAARDREIETKRPYPTTPQQTTTTGNSRFTASSRGTASPFDTMTSDFDDDGSLELSQSNDVFGNMVEPPRSARFRD